MSNNKTIILGISGGIAAVKAPALVKLLKQKGFNVEVIQTENAKKFILFPQNFNAKKVLETRKVEHIALADKADLVLIAPATANLLAKLAHGLANDYLTTLVLATQAPVIICPAMNVNMWQNPAVQANLAILQQRGVQVIMPVAGMLACGYEGLGRLEELQKIVSVVTKRMEIKDTLKGKKILVTAGPTREPIDCVRFITNSASGKMGQALAVASQQRGASVRLLLGQRDFVTGLDLLQLVKQLAPKFDVIFHTAAVGDFNVKTLPGKINSRRPVSLQLETQIKILEQIKKINPKILVVGFKAEYKLPKKLAVQTGADVTIYNDVSRKDIGFAVDDNEVILVTPRKKIKISIAPKAVIAGQILDFLAHHWHW